MGMKIIETTATVLSINKTIETPYSTIKNVVVVDYLMDRNISPYEHFSLTNYYAPGVGLVKTTFYGELIYFLNKVSAK